MSDKPILEIDIDQSAFKAYSEKFDQYRKAAEKTPGPWGEVSDRTKSIASDFEKMAAKMAAVQTLLGKIDERSKKSSKSQASASDAWGSMYHRAAQFTHRVRESTLSLAKWTGLTGLFSSILAGGGLMGIGRMAMGVSGRRTGAWGYGVDYGEYQSYLANFGRLGGATGLLRGFSSAMASGEGQGPLVALLGARASGVLARNDAAGAIAAALPAIKSIVDETNPRNMSNVLHARGLDRLGVDLSTALTIRSMSPQEIEQIVGSYRGDIAGMSLSPENLVKWQEFSTQLDRSKAEIENVFAKNFVYLAPGVERLSEAAVHFVETMLKDNGAASRWIGKIGAGIQKFADKLGSKEFDAGVDSFLGYASQLGALFSRIGAGGDPNAGLFGGDVPQSEGQRKANRWFNYLFGTNRPGAHDASPQGKSPHIGKSRGLTGLRSGAGISAPVGPEDADQSPWSANSGSEGGSADAAYAYLHKVASGGALRPGEIDKLHPDFAIKLAAAIKDARAHGLPAAGIISAARSSGRTGSIFDMRGRSLHPVGLAADIGGIGSGGSWAAHLWHKIARKHGLYGPYGPNNPREFNHYQDVPYKAVGPDNPLSAYEYDPVDQPPSRRHSMWKASGVRVPNKAEQTGKQNRVDVTDNSSANVEVQNKAVGPMPRTDSIWRFGH